MITYEEFGDAFREWKVSNSSDPFKYQVRINSDRSVKFMQTIFAKGKYAKICDIFAMSATVCFLGTLPAFIWINWIAGIACMFGCYFFNKLTHVYAERYLSQLIVEDEESFYLTQEMGVVEISKTE